MKIYEKYINKLRLYANEQSELRFAANQLLEMHAEALKRQSPTIVELSTKSHNS